MIRKIWNHTWVRLTATFILTVTVAAYGALVFASWHVTKPTQANGREIIASYNTVSAASATDYTWTSYADAQTALNAVVAAGGGSLEFLGGAYNFGGHTVTATCNNIQITGVGNSTVFSNGGISAGTNSGWTFSNLATSGAGGITYSSATNVTLIAVDLNGTYIGMQTAGTVTATTLNAPTGRTASYTFATNDASADIKAQANEILPATADETRLNAVIAALPDGSIVQILGTNISLSNEVIIDLATRKISVRGSNVKVTLTGAGGLPAFEILNQGAYVMPEPVLSGFDIDGQDRVVGRIGIQFIDNLWIPKLENISIHNMGYAILMSTVGASQQEGLTMTHCWLYDNTHGIWFPDGAISYSTVFLDDVNFNIPAGCDGIHIGNGAAIPDSYMNINMWIQGASATGIFLDGTLWGSTIVGKIENTNPDTSYGIDIGTNAVTPQWEIKLELSGDYFQNFIHNPYLKDIRFTQSPELTKDISLSSFTSANIVIPFYDGVGNYAKDFSGNFHNALLLNSPTWGTDTQLGKLIFDGTSQYSTIPNVSVGGSQTIIIVTNPNFAENENAYRYLFDIQIDANNRIDCLKYDNSGTNRVSFDYKGGGVDTECHATLGFVQNEAMVLIFTYNDTTKVGVLYYKGVSVATFSGATTISSSLGTFNLASSYAASTFWKGNLLLFASLPRCIGANEALDLTKQLSRMAGTDQ